MTHPDTPPPGWTRVASLAELGARGRMRVDAGGRDILLVLAGGLVHACGNVCAHQHVPSLHDGSLSGHEITCPRHGWSYDVRTGDTITGEGRIPVHPVLVLGDDILVGGGDR